MISIVTAYYNRKKLFIRTLNSLQSNYGKIKFEVIVVDDGSSEHERVEDLLDDYPFLRILRLDPDKKWYMNPCVPFNRGFEIAKGDKIIIQNPECCHLGDILKYVDTNLKTNTYLSFGCFSLDDKTTDDENLVSDKEFLQTLILKNQNVVKVDGGLGWYNHSVYRPMSYHFCTAIMAEDLIDLGGFDMRYANGYGYDDDDLIFRIRKKGMKVKFVDDYVVLHQNHYVKNLNSDEQIAKYKNDSSFRNRIIFNSITERTNLHRAGFLEINGKGSEFKFELKDFFRKAFNYAVKKINA